MPADPNRNGARVRDADDDFLAEQMLQLADLHRERCPGRDCTIQLLSIARVLERAGIQLTRAEMRRLW